MPARGTASGNGGRDPRGGGSPRAEALRTCGATAGRWSMRGLRQGSASDGDPQPVRLSAADAGALQDPPIPALAEPVAARVIFPADGFPVGVRATSGLSGPPPASILLPLSFEVAAGDGSITKPRAGDCWIGPRGSSGPGRSLLRACSRTASGRGRRRASGERRGVRPGRFGRGRDGVAGGKACVTTFAGGAA